MPDESRLLCSTLFPTFIIEYKAKFQLVVSERDSYDFSPSKHTVPLKPQVKNG
jgi:hypothetical protein